MLKIRFRMFILFPLLHVIAIWTLLTDPQWLLILIMSIVLYWPIHSVGFSIGYHKLFAHRSFKPKNFYPYLATFIGMLSLYGGPLASSLIHREHHKFADEERDPHSPTKGLWHAYVGWTWNYTKHGNHLLRIYDLIRDYPWMAKIEKYDLVVPLTVYPILFWINPVLGCTVLIACLLSLHTGMITNTVTHTRQGEILNLVWLANWINPIFNHKHHHKTHGYDYSTELVNDKQAWFIKKFLMK